MKKTVGKIHHQSYTREAMTPELYAAQWLDDHYEQFKRRIEAINIFDPDVLHDTFMEVSRDVAPNWEKFVGTYKRRYRSETCEAIRSVHPDPYFWDLLEEQETEQETTIEPGMLDRELQSLLNRADYDLIKMRFNLELSLHEIAMYTGQAVRAITEALGKILARIREYLTAVKPTAIWN